MSTPTQQIPAPAQGVRGSSLSVTTVTSTTTNSPDQYNFPWSGALGALQVGAGFISIGAMIASFCVHAELYFTGYGIWCGLVFILAGGFGFALAVQRMYNHCWILAFLILSCVAAPFAAAQVAMASYCLHKAPNNHRKDDGTEATELVWRLLIHIFHLASGVAEQIFSAGSIYVSASYVVKHYHQIQNPYGVLENAYYQPSGGAQSGSTHQSQPQVVFNVPDIHPTGINPS